MDLWLDQRLQKISVFFEVSSYQQGFCGRLLHPASVWSPGGTEGHDEAATKIPSRGGAARDVALTGRGMPASRGRASVDSVPIMEEIGPHMYWKTVLFAWI